MHASQFVTEYLLLGLRFDRLVKGFVDAYTGDPVLRRRVDNETVPEPARLAATARRLRAELPGAQLSEPRRRFLDAQLVALDCSGRKLAGEDVAFTTEVEAYFQVKITPGEQDEYQRAHRDLAGMLPGQGKLVSRLASAGIDDYLPPEEVQRCVHAFSSALRDRVRGRFGLPPQETVQYQVVTGQPWSGFNYYLGDFRSRVAINAELGVRMSSLPHLVAHEAYPGHHTEHCRKDRGLVDLANQAEQAIFLVNTPQCLMAEGLADLGLHTVVGPGWGMWAADIFADLGIRFDGERAERLYRATSALLPVRQDAAIMLHNNVDVDTVIAYLKRWLLLSDRKARQFIRFMSDPLWRAYTTTYVEGYRLLRGWLDARPDTVSVDERYCRLLDEPLVPEVVREELAGRIGV